MFEFTLIGDLEWPFDSLFGGHDSPFKGSRELTIPKRSPGELPGTCCFFSSGVVWFCLPMIRSLPCSPPCGCQFMIELVLQYYSATATFLYRKHISETGDHRLSNSIQKWTNGIYGFWKWYSGGKNVDVCCPFICFFCWSMWMSLVFFWDQWWKVYCP